MLTDGDLEADLMNLSWIKERTDFSFKLVLLGGYDTRSIQFPRTPFASSFAIMPRQNPEQNCEHRMLNSSMSFREGEGGGCSIVYDNLFIFIQGMLLIRVCVIVNDPDVETVKG